MSLQIGTLVLSCLAIIASLIATYVALNAAARGRQITVDLATGLDALERFDKTTEDVQAQFADLNEVIAEVTYLGGHLSARSVSAELTSKSDRLRTTLSVLAEEYRDSDAVSVIAATRLGELTHGVDDLVDRAITLLEPAVESERYGGYSDGFFEQALDKGSPWARDQARIFKRQSELQGRIDFFLAGRRTERQFLKRAVEALQK